MTARGWAVVLPKFQFRSCLVDLGEALKLSIEAAGASASLIDGFPPEGEFNVLALGAHVGAPVRCPYPCWVYQSETFGSEQWFTPEYVAYLAHAKTLGVVEFSERQADQYAAHPVLGKIARPVVIAPGIVPGMRRVEQRAEADKDIDLLFYGSVSQRRVHAFEAMMALGITPSVHFNVYGRARDELIARSKVALNVRAQDGWPEENVRLFYLDNNGACVLNERDPNEPGSIGVSYGELAEEAVRLARDPEARAALVAQRAAAAARMDATPLIERWRSLAA